MLAVWFGECSGSFARIVVWDGEEALSSGCRSLEVVRIRGSYPYPMHWQVGRKSLGVTRPCLAFECLAFVIYAHGITTSG